jgi:hypothetical protein
MDTRDRIRHFKVCNLLYQALLYQAQRRRQDKGAIPRSGSVQALTQHRPESASRERNIDRSLLATDHRKGICCKAFPPSTVVARQRL